MKKNSKIYIAGHTGMVGSAILRKLKSENYTNLILKSRKELEDGIKKTYKWFTENQTLIKT